MQPLSGFARLAVCGTWAAFTLATTSWISWQAGIDAQYSTDAAGYEQIARAAPGLPPDGALLPQHAQHFAPHYLTGLLADATGLRLHLVYRFVALIVLALIALVVDRLLTAARVSRASYAVCMGALLTSPYLFRFDALAPGMVQDATFALGATVVLLGLVEGKARTAALGVALAVAGRGDSTVVVAAAAVAWIALAGAWRGRRARGSAVVGAAFAAAEIGTFLISRHFAGGSDVNGFESFTLVGTLTALPGSVGTLGSHLARVFAGVTAPAAIACGGLVVVAASRRRPATATVAALGFGAALVAQVVAMNPGWLQGSQPRLSSFAIAPLAAAAGLLLGDLERQGAWAWSPRTLVVACAAIVLASLHLHYSVLRPASTPGRFFALELVAAALLVGPFAWRARAQTTKTLAASGRRASPSETARSARSTSSG